MSELDPFKTAPPATADYVAASPDSEASADSEACPARVGRYRVERILGEGGFGLVYLAHDEQLQRQVAIKVPHPNLISRPGDAAAYLTEARTVANLDHPHIVPVFDVGSTDQFPCYVVSKYIDGTNLATRLRQSRLALQEGVDLVATVAEALHHAHKQGLVHRDVKPGNILLDTKGRPFVADFGLALREQDIGKGPRYAGTPAYMSPEQARGEGHRVDGRSDIFSLGVVFYELLTGRRPFKADSQDALLEQITSLEARPPRQIDDAIPKEPERICLKMLSKRAAERYTTAKDLADDLRHFLAEKNAGVLPVGVDLPAAAAATAPPASVQSASATTPPASATPPCQIVPKGLRSFDAHDSDFFLELLPGPRDRDGLPDSLRFWRTRIEETDPDKTFSVGLICGPSGCGKSSLIKAGLLPRLADHVLAVYLEATAEETETRLLNGLRKCCPAMPADLGVKETLSALRRGQGIPGKKVLIVLDQFEQWLHATKNENSELVQSLRQCDGSNVQCIVMVRDDFWMATIRFMRELEIRLLEGQNSAAVDLFDLDHARKVLAAFGRAFGKLPQNPGETTKEQKQFLDQAIAGLAQDGKIICVRLALFAEMMKGKWWTPATLKEVGGTKGVGATFLEETFAASNAPAKHRYHQEAARAVLKALLPESGADIKGHMRSEAALLEASGYAGNPKDFEDLVRILDSEVRLITPTDPEGTGGQGPPRQPSSDGKFYQLTHDYLVHSLRDWLTRKQKETKRGRAELLLADRAAVWEARPENRQLPSLWQWVSIRLWTPKKDWTAPQRTMMRKARHYHGLRALSLALILAVAGLVSYEAYGRLKAQALMDRLRDANTNEVPTIVQELTPYRRWLDPLLQKANREAAATQDHNQQLHTSLALLPVDPGQVEYLYGRLLDAEPGRPAIPPREPHDVPVLRAELAGHKEQLRDKLWAVVNRAGKGQEQQRLRAAYALAAYDPESHHWDEESGSVINQLVAENPVFLAIWLEGFRPVKKKMLPPLAAIFRNPARRESERNLATNLLADYAADELPFLANLVMDADEKQFVVLYPKLKDHEQHGATLLQRELDQQLPANAAEQDKERLAKRQANAAAGLLKMKPAADVWPLLKHRPDPRVRSYLIHRFGPLGVDVKSIMQRLEIEPDVTIQRALLLSLGEFVLSPEEQAHLVANVQQIYCSADDPGIHGAAEWLLRTWQQGEWLIKTNEQWKDKKQRDQRQEAIMQELTKGKGQARPQWYVNGQGQTLVVIPGPLEFMMGSPPAEDGRQTQEAQHKKRIGRSVAVAAKPVTVEEYRRFNKDYTFTERYAPKPDCPVIQTSWYEATAYCNWLSEQEGISPDQWCYETERQGEGMKLKDKYLSLTGYRLPTEAELEYAIRAGAATSRFYGESEELLDKYAWYSKNSGERSWPVGTKKPNDLGLFDTLGNVWCWCQESYKDYPTNRQHEAVEDLEDTLLVDNQKGRLLRGGSYFLTMFVRAAARYKYGPASRDVDVGFRPARTIRATP